MKFASLDSLHNRLKDRSLARRRRATKSSRRQTTFRPAIDYLEKRNLLTTFTVINPIDGEAGSLRDAIEQANANVGADTIKFALAVDEITVSEQILITDDLTVRGPGAEKLTIYGDGDRVFAVVPAKYAEETDLFTTPTPEQLEDAPRVRIEKLSIEKGLAGNALGLENPAFAFGGGIYNLGSELHLNRVHMTGNRAVGAVTAGGAVANEFGGTLTVSRSHFVGNLSLGDVIAVGGAITSDLGPTDDGTEEGGTTTAPVVNIDRSSFVENRAETQFVGYLGPAMGNEFTGLGGGGAILNVTGAMTVTRSHFQENAASGGPGDLGFASGGAGMGGAILTGDFSPFGAAESSLVVSRSTFVGNTAEGGDSFADSVPGGIAAGGAVSVGNGSDAVLERNRFEANGVVGGVGGPGASGGIATGGGVAGSGLATLKLKRNEFTENKAEGGRGGSGGHDAAGRGGGLGLDSIELAGFIPETATASSDSDTFHGNLALGGIGGGIYNEGDLTVVKSKLSENQAIGKANVGIDFVPGYAFLGSALGGGLSNLGSVEMSGVQFEANLAVGADGALGLNLFLDGTTDYPGLATGGGFHNIGEATVSKSQFVENEARGGNNNFGSFAGSTNGGGILNDGTLELSQSLIHGNLSIGGNGNQGDINAGGGYGAGLTSGSVTALGGLRSASLRIDRTSVEGNEARGGNENAGLGLEFPPIHQPAGGIGGGILVYQGDAVISKTQVNDNLAAGGEGGLGAGGGVAFLTFAVNVQAELSQSTVANNVAIGGVGGDGTGGGILVGSLGSFFAANLPGVPNAIVTIDQTAVTCNRAQGGEAGDGIGGGIFNDDDAMTELIDSIVGGNRAVGGEGGDGIDDQIANFGELDLIRTKVFAKYRCGCDDDHDHDDDHDRDDDHHDDDKDRGRSHR